MYFKKLAKNTTIIGRETESLANNFLLNQGLQWLCSNYRCYHGEIDLIMRHNQYLVFVEVRSRNSLNFGGAIASITPAKQKKLIKTAMHYQITTKQWELYPCRFDLILLQGKNNQIEWLQNFILGED